MALEGHVIYVKRQCEGLKAMDELVRVTLSPTLGDNASPALMSFP
jgi:hypothetical protein